MADEVIGGVSVEVRGDFSKLAGDFDAAATAAAGLATKFGEGIAGAIGTGIGGVLVQQLLSSGALSGITSSISSAIASGIASVDFSAIGGKLKSVFRDAVESIDVSSLEAKVSGAFSGVGDAAGAEFAAAQAAATDALGGLGSAAAASTASVTASVSGAASSFGALAAESASATASVLGTGAALAAVTAGATLAAAAVIGLVTTYTNMIQQQALFAAQTRDSFQTVNTLQGAAGLLGDPTNALTSVFGGANLTATLATLGTSIDTTFSASRLQAVVDLLSQLQVIPDPVDRAATAVKLFGANAAQALQLANDATKDAIAQAYDLSTAWDQSTRESLQRISDFWTAVKGFFSQTLDFTAGWDQLKQAIVTSVTDLETSIRQFVLLGESDFHDMGVSISDSITQGLRSLSNATGIDFSGWAQVGLTIGGYLRDGIINSITGALTSPDVQLSLANAAYMQQQLAGALRGGLAVPTAGIAAQTANPGLFQAAQQIVTDNAEIGDSYAALSAAVTDLTAKQELNFAAWQRDPTNANLALAITNTQALIDKDQALVDKTDAATQAAKLLAQAWGAVGVANPVNAVNNLVNPDTGDVTALSPLNAFVALVNSGQLQGAALATAFDNVEKAITTAFHDGSISAEAFAADIQTIENGLARGTGDVTNFGVATRTFTSPVSEGSLIALLEETGDWAGLTKLQDQIAQATNGVSGINTAWAAQNALLDKASSDMAGISGDLETWKETWAAVAVSAGTLPASISGMTGPLQSLADGLKNSFGALAPYVQYQIMEPLSTGFLTAKEQIQQASQALQELMDQERLAGQQVTADQSQQLATLKLMMSSQGDLWNSVNKSVSSIFTTMSSGLVSAVFDWQNFGKDITKVLDNIAQKIITDLIDNLLLTKNNINALTTAFTSILQGGSPGGALSSLAGNLHIGNAAAGATPSIYTSPIGPQPEVQAGGGGGDLYTQLGVSILPLVTSLGADVVAVNANTAALGAAIAAQYASTIQNVAMGNVIQGAFAPIPPALTQVSETFQPIGGDVVNLGKGLVDNTAAVLPNTAATLPNTDALTAMVHDLSNLKLGPVGGGVPGGIGLSIPGGGSSGTAGIPGGAVSESITPIGGETTSLGGSTVGATSGITSSASDLSGTAASSGGLGSALSGIGGTISSLAGGNLIGAGIAAAAGITAGIQAEHLNNLMDEVEKSTRGALNQLEDLQASANQYWPELTHLVDIWAAILQVDADFVQDRIVSQNTSGTTQTGNSPVLPTYGSLNTVPPTSGTGVPLVTVTDSSGNPIDPATTSDITAHMGPSVSGGLSTGRPTSTDPVAAQADALQTQAQAIQAMTAAIPASAYYSAGSGLPIAVQTTFDAIKTSLLTPAQIAMAPGGGGTPGATPAPGSTFGFAPGQSPNQQVAGAGYGTGQTINYTGFGTPYGMAGGGAPLQGTPTYTPEQIQSAGTNYGNVLQAQQTTYSYGTAAPNGAQYLTSDELSALHASLDPLIGTGAPGGPWTSDSVAQTIAAIGNVRDTNLADFSGVFSQYAGMSGIDFGPGSAAFLSDQAAFKSGNATGNFTQMIGMAGQQPGLNQSSRSFASPGSQLSGEQIQAMVNTYESQMANTVSNAVPALPAAGLQFPTAPTNSQAFISSLSTALATALRATPASMTANVIVNTVNPLTAFVSGIRNVGVKL